jgi:hypothetical protein
MDTPVWGISYRDLFIAWNSMVNDRIFEICAKMNDFYKIGSVNGCFLIRKLVNSS